MTEHQLLQVKKPNITSLETLLVSSFLTQNLSSYKSVGNLFFLSQNLKEMNLQKYSSITYVLNKWFYLLNVSFVCTYNPVVL